MKDILLLCNQGMSTGFLVQKMQEAAKNRDIDVNIHAESETRLADLWQSTNAILLGPQVGYLEDFVKETVNNERPVAVISPIDFGRNNAEHVLDQALEMLKGE